jgi:hypothetical protein
MNEKKQKKIGYPSLADSDVDCRVYIPKYIPHKELNILEYILDILFVRPREIIRFHGPLADK